MIIAVDFDGTIVEHEFPAIGKELPGAIQTMKDLQAAGHQIVIWTCRNGITLAEAVLWLRERGFAPDAVNANICDCRGYAVPKIVASVYIDDRNFGGFPGWSTVRAHLLENENMVKLMNERKVSITETFDEKDLPKVP